MENNSTLQYINKYQYNKCLNNLSPAQKLLQNCLNFNSTNEKDKLHEKYKIPRIDGNSCSYSDFFQYMYENKPVIIENITESWKCKKEWTNMDGTSNFNIFSKLFPNSSVQVAFCNKQNFNDQCREIMSVSEFVEKSNNLDDNNTLYLKDWHLFTEYPSYNAYNLPLLFSDDWINEFWDYRNNNENKDDYRFVYIGKKGSFTPLHKDVFRSYSWSSNISGTKLWHLYPVEDTKYLFGGFGNKETVWDIREWENSDELQSKFPNFKFANPIVCTQYPGETIFVPSGWYHQVENLEDTISINHNWGNACNIDLFWDFLKSELKLVELELDDCKDITEDWNELCQKIMNLNTGINYDGFISYFEFCCKRQLKIAKDISLQINENIDNNRLFYIIFTLKKLESIIPNMIEEINNAKIQLTTYETEIQITIEKLEKIIEEI